MGLDTGYKGRFREKVKHTGCPSLGILIRENRWRCAHGYVEMLYKVKSSIVWLRYRMVGIEGCRERGSRALPALVSVGQSEP